MFCTTACLGTRVVTPRAMTVMTGSITAGSGSRGSQVSVRQHSLCSPGPHSDPVILTLLMIHTSPQWPSEVCFPCSLGPGTLSSRWTVVEAGQSQVQTWDAPRVLFARRTRVLHLAAQLL